MIIQLPNRVLKIIEKFQSQNREIYIVGGAVRDILMNKPVYDWDFTTNATPEEILAFFPKSFYNNQFGTVSIPPSKKGERPEEITTFRTERGYQDARHPSEVRWGQTLKEDLKRRDFTINAMALKIIKIVPPAKAELIDYFNGQADLKKKLIRAVGDPNERFGEDALRMVRAVRIATELNFEIEGNTLEAIRKNAPLIKKIAVERVRDELLKILASDYPQKGIELFRESGLMEIILPELEKNFGVDQVSPNRHHIYDVGTHSLFTLKYTALKNRDPITRLAALIHDIGKYRTFKKLEDGTITFYNHEVISSQIAAQIADRLRLSKKQKEKLVKLVRCHQFTVDEKQTDSAIRRFIREVGKENLKDILDIRTGDRLGSGAKETSWRLEEFKKRLIEVQKQPFSLNDLKIDGWQVMKILKIKPGPEVGEVLNYLFEKVTTGEIKNEKKDLEEAVIKTFGDKI